MISRLIALVFFWMCFIAPLIYSTFSDAEDLPSPLAATRQDGLEKMPRKPYAPSKGEKEPKEGDYSAYLAANGGAAPAPAAAPEKERKPAALPPKHLKAPPKMKKSSTKVPPHPDEKKGDDGELSVKVKSSKGRLPSSVAKKKK